MKVYTEAGEYKIANIHMLPYGEKHKTLWSDSHPGVNWTPLFRQEVYERLTILELEESAQEVRSPVIYCGMHDEQQDPSLSWKPFAWENLDVVRAETGESGEVEPIILRIPYALFSKYYGIEDTKENCLLLGFSMSASANLKVLCSSVNPVNVGKLLSAERAYLVRLNHRYIAVKDHAHWKCELFDQGCPIYTSSGQLIGLGSTEQCFDEESKEINDAFPIITLIDPETGRLREDVAQLFGAAGLSIADDGMLLVKE